VSVDVEPAAGNGEIATPTFALTALGLTLVGFGVSSLFGVEPVWVALAGALVLGPRVGRRPDPAGRHRARGRSGVLPVRAGPRGGRAGAGHGLGMALAAVLPTAPTLGGLLLVAALAAVLSNVLNNLPAALLLLAVLGDAPAPGVVLAALVGVNVGPNLSYLGSLATLLWRRALNGTGAAPGIGEFTALGVLTVPPALLAAVVTMWATLPLVTP
jgi:arsenical pump membrane protein